ncbi:hypothetical protein DM56_4123 [Burkholderia mallei]|nr:hypothetical protein X989_4904 [Burkholderia pseudomallei MSHR4378]KGS21042.1 hypothetical protein X962_5514 [Burkholderia pseudomallei MSHR7343]KOS92913.1 hypothetical protein DM45_2563 [Burkholderia mallei]KOT01866.1 hypothetical protein DM50_2805 [Burkholderia mallei]KOT11229.1 hypothetical protein DM56_4123 [Burkholderia mallei]
MRTIQTLAGLPPAFTICACVAPGCAAAFGSGSLAYENESNQPPNHEQPLISSAAANGQARAETVRFVVWNDMRL